jgi:uncharacterized protein YjbI with pentapeptide repeats
MGQEPAPISAEALRSIRDAAPHEHGRPQLGSKPFTGVTFTERADFTGVTFTERADFTGARFTEGADFTRTTFTERVSFSAAEFEGEVSFSLAKFEGEVRFYEPDFPRGPGYLGAIFMRGAYFRGTTFCGLAVFTRTTFTERVSFSAASFKGEVTFREADFRRGAGFSEATFTKEVSFYEVAFKEDVDFSRAKFRGPATFERTKFASNAWFDGAHFMGKGATLDLTEASFALPVSILVETHSVVVDRAEFGAPSIVAGFPQDPHPPSVKSLREAHVANLVIADADLQACRFAGANNLDQLRLQGAICFPGPPAGWKVGWAFPPMWRWTRRRTLAEENHWRQCQPKGKGWYPTEYQPRGLDKVKLVEPPDIAKLYRALRKGLEDAKDEPGAVDFYYGEMEMRRHADGTPFIERLILRAYWLLAGYGLRASRALGWLLAVLVLATMMLAWTGLAPPRPTAPMVGTISGLPPHQTVRLEQAVPEARQPSFPDRLGTAALVATEGAVFRTSEQELTYKGKLIQTALRFVGPVLLGLALLSVRGRVKR